MAEQCNEHLPAVVLGSVAAERLGISTLTQPTYVYIGEQYVEVVGTLEEFRYQPTSTDPQLWGNQRLKNSLKVTPPRNHFCSSRKRNNRRKSSAHSCDRRSGESGRNNSEPAK